jgi:cyclic pyranopterin phosphate synthase
VKRRNSPWRTSIVAPGTPVTDDAPGPGKARPAFAKATVRAGQVRGREGSVKAGRRLPSLSHVDRRGRVRMVDVGGKPITDREAIARGSIRMSREAIRQIRAGAVKKGDPLQAARLAGIMAAKQTATLIPLCHPLPLSSVHVELTPTARGYTIEARVRTSARTGVEMEALTAVAVAALTIYDMVKAVDKAMTIDGICLVRKTGGRSGTYQRK